jgi:hypothetical protein
MLLSNTLHICCKLLFAHSKVSLHISLLDDSLLVAYFMCYCVVLGFPFVRWLFCLTRCLFVNLILIHNRVKMTPLRKHVWITYLVPTSRSKLSGRYKLRVEIKQWSHIWLISNTIPGHCSEPHFNGILLGTKTLRSLWV